MGDHLKDWMAGLQLHSLREYGLERNLGKDMCKTKKKLLPELLRQVDDDSDFAEYMTGVMNYGEVEGQLKSKVVTSSESDSDDDTEIEVEEGDHDGAARGRGRLARDIDGVKGELRKKRSDIVLRKRCHDSKYLTAPKRRKLITSREQLSSKKQRNFSRPKKLKQSQKRARSARDSTSSSSESDDSEPESDSSSSSKSSSDSSSEGDDFVQAKVTKYGKDVRPSRIALATEAMRSAAIREQFALNAKVLANLKVCDKAYKKLAGEHTSRQYRKNITEACRRLRKRNKLLVVADTHGWEVAKLYNSERQLGTGLSAKDRARDNRRIEKAAERMSRLARSTFVPQARRQVSFRLPAAQSLPLPRLPRNVVAANTQAAGDDEKAHVIPDRASGACYACGKMGHLAAQCPSKRRAAH